MPGSFGIAMFCVLQLRVGANHHVFVKRVHLVKACSVCLLGWSAD